MKLNKLMLAGILAGATFTSSVYAQTLKLAHALPTEHPVHQSLSWFADHVKDETKSSVYAQTLKLAHALPTEHPVHQSLSWFADHVKDETKIRVKVYANGTLGNETSLLQMVQNGTVAFTKVSAAPLESFSKDYKIILPYLYSSEQQYRDVLNGPIGDKILASSRDDGFVGLAFLDAGARSFYTDKAIKTPADLKGMKIRVQNSPLAIDIIKSLGQPRFHYHTANYIQRYSKG